MARFILRVWLPDKPGALGNVASAIGSVGASLVGIEILEQDGGYAIDELVVEAVDSVNATDKLVVALTFLEGVNVEDIRESRGEVIDSRIDALETAAELVEQTSFASVLDVLVRRARHDMSASWAVALEMTSDIPLASVGELPSIPWVKAFLEGSRSSEMASGSHHGPEDIAWSELHNLKAALVIGRDGRAFRARERKQIAALSRVADHHASNLVRIR